MKITQCKSCLYNADTDDGICPVCGINQDKAKKNLTKEERKIRSAVRGIRAVSVLHVLVGIFILFIFPFLIAALHTHGPSPAPFPENPLANLAYYLALGAGLLVLSVGLRKYAKWAYYLTTLTYGIIMVISLINPNIGLLVVILCAYYIWNKRARAIFNRSVKSANNDGGHPSIVK